MGQYDYAIDANHAMNAGDYDFDYEVPEPIDQWAVEDFEQFACLIVNAE